MTIDQAKDALLNYTCCCKYGTSPVNCSDEECYFGKAVKTLCNRPQGDLISREALKKAFEETVIIEPMPYAFVKQIIDNSPTVEGEEVAKLKRENTALEQEMLYCRENWKKAERQQGEFVKILNERIEKGVCKFCQMNKHCELCEISRVFMIIALADNETKGGKEE